MIHIVSELGKENKIVGNKSEEDLAAVQSGQGQQVHHRQVHGDQGRQVSREVKGIALNKIDFIFGCQFLFECGNIGIGKFKSRDFITLTSKVEAVFTCTCANVEYLVAIFQIFSM